MERFVRHRETADERAKRLMRFVSQPGPCVPLSDLSGFVDPLDWAAGVRVALQPWAERGDNLRILLLCAGADAPGHALKSMGVPFEAEVWDIDMSLKPSLMDLHRSSEKLHIGRIEGDILQQTCCGFAPAHVLVAGPPCPPWSSLGSGDSFCDPRADVMMHVVEIIACQAWRSQWRGYSEGFRMFLLENVEGMLKRSKADRDAGLGCPLQRVQ